MRDGLAPQQILAAPEEVLAGVVAGARPAERVQRLRRCAELAIAGAPWRAYPGIGAPGADRIDLFTGTRAVLALDAHGLPLRLTPARATTSIRSAAPPTGSARERSPSRCQESSTDLNSF